MLSSPTSSLPTHSNWTATIKSSILGWLHLTASSNIMLMLFKLCTASRPTSYEITSRASYDYVPGVRQYTSRINTSDIVLWEISLVQLKTHREKGQTHQKNYIFVSDWNSMTSSSNASAQTSSTVTLVFSAIVNYSFLSVIFFKQLFQLTTSTIETFEVDPFSDSHAYQGFFFTESL